MRGDPSNPKVGAWIVSAMLGIVAVPVGITLLTVRDPASVQLSSSNPTPFGYSWSLLLFIIPILVIGGWFLPSERVRIPKTGLLADNLDSGADRIWSRFLLRAPLL